jgi:hypothetical protein
MYVTCFLKPKFINFKNILNLTFKNLENIVILTLYRYDWRSMDGPNSRLQKVISVRAQ